MILVSKFLARLKHDGIWNACKASFEYVLDFNRRRAYQKILASDDLQEKFTNIYQANVWRSKELGSGEGSEVEYTARIREWLLTAIPKYGIKRFVDAPCGDFNWMRLIVPQIDIDYMGFDIVQSVVDQNNAAQGNSKTKFAVANICTDPLPSCDIMMVRDCLFHLSYDDIDMFLKNISAVDFKYLLTTTHIVDAEYVNSDIVSGSYRNIDLFSAPFCFDKKKVIEFVEDFPKGARIRRHMVLIAKNDVPTSLCG